MLNEINFDIKQDNIVDLQHLKTYIIDSNDTEEVDDAISFEYVNNQKRIWVHIASPAEYINKDSKVSKLAREKATTTYLINNRIYMFPIEQVKRFIGFKVNHTNIAISCATVIDSNGRIVNFNIYRTLIKPTYQLTYTEADEILDYQPVEEDDLFQLFLLMKARAGRRQKEGAIIFNETQGRLKIDNSAPFYETLEYSDSRFLISEAMILYCKNIASFCKKNSIAVPYRNQSISLTIKEIIKEYPLNDHLKNHKIKRLLSKPTIETTSKGHYSLGIAEYVQASSPLRRYLDFIVNHQLISYLQDKPLIGIQEIEDEITNYIKIIAQSKQIVNEDRTKWNLIFFSNNISREWKVTFLEYLNYKSKLILVYFNIISVDIVVKVNLLSLKEYGESLTLVFDKKSLVNNVLIFNEVI